MSGRVEFHIKAAAHPQRVAYSVMDVEYNGMLFSWRQVLNKFKNAISISFAQSGEGTLVFIPGPPEKLLRDRSDYVRGLVQGYAIGWRDCRRAYNLLDAVDGDGLGVPGDPPAVDDQD